MRSTVFAAALALGAAPAARAQAPARQPPAPQAPAPAVLDCAAFPKATDEAALVRRFGRENVAAAELDGAEGGTARGTAIFPRDPARRLEVAWRDEGRRRGLASVAIRGRSAWAVRVPGGARVDLRTDLAALEAANGRPFRVNGFGWDYGGYGAGWGGGRLERLDGGCFLGVRFDPDPKVRGRALDRASGERPLGSSDPALRAVRPALSSITLDWPE